MCILILRHFNEVEGVETSLQMPMLQLYIFNISDTYYCFKQTICLYVLIHVFHSFFPHKATFQEKYLSNYEDVYLKLL